MEAEREKFRAYIESSGLMSALTNVLATLYKEPNKPKDALSYVIEALDSTFCHAKEIKILEEKSKNLEAEVQELKEKIRLLEESRNESKDNTLPEIKSAP